MPVITVRNLETIGRFGNKLFLWVFARAYARAMKCELQTPDWVGRKIFIEAANEPRIARSDLPQTEIETHSKKPIGYFFGRTGIDINAYCQHQAFLTWFTRRDVREWLRLKPEFESYAPKQGLPYSAAHLRRGDYVTDPVHSRHYCTVSDASYKAAISQFNIPEPIFWVQDGWRESTPRLAKQGLDWLPDWLLLRDAAHLLRGNSSFSQWAGWAGNGKVYAPTVGCNVGPNTVPFVEGNWPNTAGIFKNQSDLHLKD